MAVETYSWWHSSTVHLCLPTDKQRLWWWRHTADGTALRFTYVFLQTNRDFGCGDIQLMAQFYGSRMSSYRQTETLTVETYSWWHSILGSRMSSYRQTETLAVETYSWWHSSTVHVCLPTDKQRLCMSPQPKSLFVCRKKYVNRRAVPWRHTADGTVHWVHVCLPTDKQRLWLWRHTADGTVHWVHVCLPTDKQRLWL